MTRLDGIDISHHNDDAGPIDWPEVKLSGVWWVASKATQGLRYVDPTFTAHRTQMAAQGFRQRLFYHWLSHDTDVSAQAHHFLDTIGHLAPGEGAMLDAEEGGITAAQALDWCHTVESFTHRPVAIYTGAYVAGGTIWQSTQIRHSVFGARPMHLAAYCSEAKALTLPGVVAYPWHAWQYSSNGPVRGVTGRCDMNRVDNRDVFDRACGITAKPVPHPPSGDDMPIIITHSEPHTYDGQTYSNHDVKWVVMPDGTKRHLLGVEYSLYDNGTGGVALSNDDLATLPDWHEPVGGTVDTTARDSAANANAAVAKVGQELGDTKMHLQRAGD